MTGQMQDSKSIQEIKGDVLIVDDNAENLRLLTNMLSGAGYKARPAPTGNIALASLQSFTPDCILLDIRMPEMDGFEVCRRLKNEKKTSSIPVLFISGLSETDDKLKGFRAGAVDYIIKPFQQEEVLVRVGTHVALYKMRQQLALQVDQRTVELTNTIAKLDAEIKERRQAEKERSRFFEAVRQSAESIVITDLAGIIQFVNPAFETMTGYQADEVLGRNASILQSGKHDSQFYQEMWKTLTSKKVWHGELVNRKKDGTLFIEKATISPVFDQHDRIVNYIALKSDITHERHLEEQLRHAQKMETVGRLAGGVAHDFNNMLSVILGTTQMLLLRDTLDEPVSQGLEQIQTAARRSAEITRQLLAFSRKQVIDPKVVNVNPLVRDIVKMLGRLLGEDITLLFIPDDKIENVKIDPGQLHQIITNLCINARDAMEDGGKLTIETAAVIFDDQYCRDHAGFHPGHFVMLAISDTGIGIDEELLEHIFEPFFTTKEEGKGTGLGLASVYGAVKHSNGFINVYSEPGVGTTFKLYFPVCSEQGEAVTLAVEDTAIIEPLCLLLVEDNTMVRNLTTSMLETMGHEVVAADSPEQALELCRSKGFSFDLLLTDVVMPGMTGKHLHQALQQLYPEIRTVFMSGYTANVIVHHGVLKEGICFLQKPFSMQDLARRIHDAMTKTLSMR